MPRVTGFGRGGSKHKKKAHGTHSEREGNQGITGPLFNPVLQDVTITTENVAQASTTDVEQLAESMATARH